MLGNLDVMANLAVRDLQKAKRFYQDVLGLTLVHAEGDEAITFKSGKAAVIVYRSRFAGTNQATAATWDAGDRVAELVRALKEKGVRFEHYDLPGLRLEGDLHVADGFKTAWFKDLDGNILCLLGR